MFEVFDIICHYLLRVQHVYKIDPLDLAKGKFLHFWGI